MAHHGGGELAVAAHGGGLGLHPHQGGKALAGELCAGNDAGGYRQGFLPGQEGLGHALLQGLSVHGLAVGAPHQLHRLLGDLIGEVHRRDIEGVGNAFGQGGHLGLPLGGEGQGGHGVLAARAAGKPGKAQPAEGQGRLFREGLVNGQLDVCGEQLAGEDGLLPVAVGHGEGAAADILLEALTEQRSGLVGAFAAHVQGAAVGQAGHRGARQQPAVAPDPAAKSEISAHEQGGKRENGDEGDQRRLAAALLFDQPFGRGIVHSFVTSVLRVTVSGTDGAALCGNCGYFTTAAAG